MRKIHFVLLLTIASNISFGQNKIDAENLVNKGIGFHDKGEYETAISKYDSALQLDKDNLLALAEKAYTLFSLQKYDESIKCCQRAIEIHPKEKTLMSVYVTYGNVFDEQKLTDKAIKTFDAGIKQFPDYYQLYFNKGISLSRIQKNEDAILCFQKAVSLNPAHASSHNAIARLSNISNQRIPAILAYGRFLSIEPKSNRAKENLLALLELMRRNVEQTGEKVTINLSADDVKGINSKRKPKENSFASTDLILTMDASMDFDEKNKGKSDVEQFIRKLNTLCSSLKESRADNSGFYWSYYAPYFIALKDEGLIETFAYISFASSESQDVSSWLNSHKTEIDKFFTWSKAFQWQAN